MGHLFKWSRNVFIEIMILEPRPERNEGSHQMCIVKYTNTNEELWHVPMIRQLDSYACDEVNKGLGRYRVWTKWKSSKGIIER